MSDISVDPTLLSPTISEHQKKMLQTRRNSARGALHELSVGEHLIANSGGLASWSDEPHMAESMRSREAHRSFICEHFPADEAELDELARKHVERLPKAVGKVSLVDVCHNVSAEYGLGEVYDIVYYSADDPSHLVKVSCKTGNMEDKCLRLNSADRFLLGANAITSSIFGQAVGTGKTYAQVLSEADSSVENLQQQLQEELWKVARSESNFSSDSELLLDVSVKHVIGAGDYYKTLKNGSVTYYPRAGEGLRVRIIGEPQKRGGSSVDFVVGFFDDSKNSSNTVKKTSETVENDNDSSLVSQYKLSWRIKFKDGKDKPVKAGANGGISNLAFTIQLAVIK